MLSSSHTYLFATNQCCQLTATCVRSVGINIRQFANLLRVKVWLAANDIICVETYRQKSKTFTNETSGPKFTILWGHVYEILLLNKFFFRLSIHVLVAKIYLARQSCGMVTRWRFLATFWVLHLQRAACSTFQTCILNSH